MAAISITVLFSITLLVWVSNWVFILLYFSPFGLSGISADCKREIVAKLGENEDCPRSSRPLSYFPASFNCLVRNVSGKNALFMCFLLLQSTKIYWANGRPIAANIYFASHTAICNITHSQFMVCQIGQDTMVVNVRQFWDGVRHQF